MIKQTLKKTAIQLFDSLLCAVCQKPTIADKDETVNRIVENQCSIARFGDGELGLIFGRPLGFQKYDPLLADRLSCILKYDANEKLLIGISKAIFTAKSPFYSKYRVRYLCKIRKQLNWKKQYYEADISRFYKKTSDGSQEIAYLEKMKEIWDNRSITIVEGEKSRMGVGNDLLDNAKSIKRILCPAENAFSCYQDIYEKVIELIPKDDLLLIALGPTATVLAFDLFQAGYQAIDIGHIDISYEWFFAWCFQP